MVAWIWLGRALVALSRLDGASGEDADFYRGKLAAADWFFAWELPKTAHWATLVEDSDPTVAGTRPEWL